MARLTSVLSLAGMLAATIGLGCYPSLREQSCSTDRDCLTTEYCNSQGICIARYAPDPVEDFTDDQKRSYDEVVAGTGWEHIDFTAWQESTEHPNPLIGPGFSGGTFDSNGAFCSSVLHDEAAHNYKMWYTGMDADLRDRIGFATSEDGYTWVPYSPNPVIGHNFCDSYSSWHAHYPVVIQDEDRFVMWFSGDSYGRQHTCMATSDDGANWVSHYRVIDWSVVYPNVDYQRHMIPWSVVKEGEVYRMWYSCITSQKPFIGHATSTDGVVWENFTTVLIGGAAGQWDHYSLYFPAVIRLDSRWYLFYSANEATDRPYQTGLAVSDDGIHWSRHPENPVLTLGDGGQWDSSTVWGASLVLEHDRLRMWYSGSIQAEPGQRIGHVFLDGPDWHGAVGDYCDQDTECQSTICFGHRCSAGLEADPCVDSTDCAADAPICSSHHVCQDGSEGDDCDLPADCDPLEAPICASAGVCQDGSEGDDCDLPADCHPMAAPICASAGVCQDGSEGDDCDLPADCDPMEAPICASGGVCQDGSEGDDCDLPADCDPLAAPICASGGVCQDGSEGDPCSGRSDCSTLRCLLGRCSNSIPGCRLIDDPSLYLYYPLEETAGSIVADDSGNSHHGTSGAAVVERGVTGVVGNAFRLDSVASPGRAIRIDGSFDWQWPEGSVEMWAWVEDVALEHQFFSYDPTGSPNSFLLERLREPYAEGRLALSQGGTEAAVQADERLPTGSWIHVAANWGPGGRHAYLNGKLVVSDAGDTDPVGHAGAPDELWYVGGQSYLSPGQFVGRIDEVCLYDQQLDFDYLTWSNVDFTAWQESTEHPNPLIGPGFSGGTFDSDHIVDGYVLYDDTAGEYKAWYTGQSSGRTQIGFATSPDGYTWTPYSTNPVIPFSHCGSYDDWHTKHPVVLQEGSTFRMWYTGDTYGRCYTCLSTSTDGASWTSEGMVIDWVSEFGTSDHWARYVYPTTIVRDGELYKMWYNTGYGPASTIGYATSDDGVTWDIYGNVMDSGSAGDWDEYQVQFPAVIQLDGEWYMFYSGRISDGGASGIGLAISDDGIDWTRYPDNPVIPQGETGAWDDSFVQRAYPLLENDTLRMWYTGGDGGPMRIGHVYLEGR
ncbi:MAG: hypothetical protein JW797_02635 [Bradymonadales bacterium]|nr:hypothetical protein [Bradymonadales bacterium]